MCSFHETFEHRQAVLPVIHVASVKQAVKNAEIAFGAGADGIFPINHGGMSAKKLLSIYASVRQDFANKWIGVICAIEVICDVFGSNAAGNS